MKQQGILGVTGTEEKHHPRLTGCGMLRHLHSHVFLKREKRDVELISDKQ